MNQPSSPPQDVTPDQVQAENLLSQPDPDTGQVAEEVSLDQQSDQARRIGQLPPEVGEAVARSLRPDQPPKPA